jgi:cation diffusion facilitator CzcD-associated flavoprotein CzcO
VLIVGAGLSGIGAAYRLQTSCPTKTFALVEGRERLGGTWDLFRYPGIRSDSDMFTLGYPFRPWENAKAIGDGAAILAYIRETAEAYGIDRKIRYQRRMERASWSSDDARWTVDLRDTSSGDLTRVRCAFLLMCTGYYDYDAGYTPDFPERERFRGKIVHPQKWTPDIAYDALRVVVIGSGATAVTLVPELAKRAAHVTMLQRSPSYIISMPERDAVADFFRDHLPPRHAYAAARLKNVGISMGFYAFCRRFPEQAKRLLVRQVKSHLRGAADVAPHFIPSYYPWDQRLCLVPNADLFHSIRERRATVVTDQIETFTETGIRLRSGNELPADVIVTATGLNMKFLGGAEIVVDGERMEPAERLVYKGMMFSDVPNMALAMGYTNASWTLKCDLTNQYVCRLLNYMDAHGYVRACPRRRDPSMKEEPLIDFSSGYVKRALDRLPRQGAVAPWKLYQNYALDVVTLKHARLDDRAMEFRSS